MKKMTSLLFVGLLVMFGSSIAATTDAEAEQSIEGYNAVIDSLPPVLKKAGQKLRRFAIIVRGLANDDEEDKQIAQSIFRMYTKLGAAGVSDNDKRADLSSFLNELTAHLELLNRDADGRLVDSLKNDPSAYMFTCVRTEEMTLAMVVGVLTKSQFFFDNYLDVCELFRTDLFSDAEKSVLSEEVPTDELIHYSLFIALLAITYKKRVDTELDAGMFAKILSGIRAIDKSLLVGFAGGMPVAHEIIDGFPPPVQSTEVVGPGADAGTGAAAGAGSGS